MKFGLPMPFAWGPALWVPGSPDNLPPLLPPSQIADPINVAPGFQVHVTGDVLAINGSPAYGAATVVTLNDEGYYEIDVGNNVRTTRYVVCVVDTAKLIASLQSPTVDARRSFEREAASLAAAYPHGRVVPTIVDGHLTVDVIVDRAAILEVRTRTADGTYVRAARVVARSAGTWTSEGFSTARGIADLRLAAVVSDSATVLSP